MYRYELYCLSGRLAMLATALLSVCAAAVAQDEAVQLVPKPVQAASSAYVSAFAIYQALRLDGTVGWQEANETARELGGHMGHMATDP
jgi:hypothetical protein